MMSADNWTICPQCAKEANSEAQAKREKAKESYGKVIAEEYLRYLREADAIAEFDAEETLREDYSIGIRDGKLSVFYSAGYTKCGFDHTFKYTEEV